MLQNFFSIRQFRLTKWSFLVHSTTCNAPYIHPSHDSILELWRTFPNVYSYVEMGELYCDEKLTLQQGCLQQTYQLLRKEGRYIGLHKK